MKLELKHLAPYLPYGLELIFQKSGRTITMQSLFDNGTLYIIDGNVGNEYSLSLWDFKPILRPLSDLTKEIEVNGERFVPIDVVGEDINQLCDMDFISDWSQRGGNFVDYVDEFIKNKWSGHHLSFLPYGFVQKLFEWHFDVFSLIEPGLAIDINTLNQNQIK